VSFQAAQVTVNRTFVFFLGWASEIALQYSAGVGLDL
jgi:hypothetical protein